jgi:hypothetical protein
MPLSKIRDIVKMLEGLPEDEIDRILKSVKEETFNSTNQTLNGNREQKIRKILDKVKESKSSFELLRVME